MPKNDENRYYDLCLHAYPEGASTISRLALLARNYGYSGIGISNHSDFFESVAEQYVPSVGFKVIQGVEIYAKNGNELRKLVDRYRARSTVLAVHGGDEAVNRSACEDSRIDILLHPQDSKTSGINHILAKLAADKNIAIGFDMSPIISNKGGSRVRVLSNYRTNLALVKKYETPFVLTSGAMSIYDLRDVRSMIALTRLFGMGEADAVKGLSHYPSLILKRNTPGSGYIMEGVELV
jgi:ribonuclease P/MRP protein subunit RPP1